VDGWLDQTVMHCPDAAKVPCGYLNDPLTPIKTHVIPSMPVRIGQKERGVAPGAVEGRDQSDGHVPARCRASVLAVRRIRRGSGCDVDGHWLSCARRCRAGRQARLVSGVLSVVSAVSDLVESGLVVSGVMVANAFVCRWGSR